MAGQEKKRNPRNAALILDLLHIVIGILVVICAILAFLDPEGNSILFPVIFWLGRRVKRCDGRISDQNERTRQKEAGGGSGPVPAGSDPDDTGRAKCHQHLEVKIEKRNFKMFKRDRRLCFWSGTL